MRCATSAAVLTPLCATFCAAVAACWTVLGAAQGGVHDRLCCLLQALGFLPLLAGSRAALLRLRTLSGFDLGLFGLSLLALAPGFSPTLFSLGSLRLLDLSLLRLDPLDHSFRFLIAQGLQNRRKEFLLVVPDMLLEHPPELSHPRGELLARPWAYDQVRSEACGSLCCR